jgi:hypothetical protein
LVQQTGALQHLGELCRKPFLGKRLRNTRISHNAHNGRGRASGNAVPTAFFYSLFAVPAPKLLALNSSETFVEKLLLNTPCRGIYRATVGAAKTSPAPTVASLVLGISELVVGSLTAGFLGGPPPVGGTHRRRSSVLLGLSCRSGAKTTYIPSPRISERAAASLSFSTMN